MIYNLILLFAFINNIFILVYIYMQSFGMAKALPCDFGTMQKLMPYCCLFANDDIVWLAVAETLN